MATALPTLQNVETGTVLFRPGEARTIYRVETGALSHFMQWPDGRKEVIEFAFPGDLIGLGYLSVHVSSAHAMVDTVVSLEPEASYRAALASDDVLALRLTAAAEREFDYMRALAEQSVNPRPAVRLAAYLAVVASMDGRGSDDAGHHNIADANCSPEIAALLRMDMDTMGAALAQLHRKGLVSPVDGGLEVADLAALERFADAG